MLLTSETAATRLGLEPRGRFVSFGLAGVDPHRMLHGNPQACAKALGRAGLTWDDIAVIEVNEAFASVVLQFAHDAGLEDRWDDINPNGGGISLGHPLGATGARMTATLLNELDRRGERYGIAAMCVGFGMAIAGVVERFLSQDWLLVRGRGSHPLPAHVDRDAIRAHGSSKRPSVQPGERAILYAAVWQAVYAVARSPASRRTTRSASAWPGGSRSGRSSWSTTSTTRRRSRRPGSSRRASGVIRTSGLRRSSSSRRRS